MSTIISRATLYFPQCGNVGVWDIDKGSDGVLEFKPHVGAVPRLEFDPLDGHKLLSTSYDGSVRRMDVEKGNFEQASNGSTTSYPYP